MCDLLRKGLNMHLKEILQSDDFEEDVKHIAEKIPLTEEWFNIAKKYYLNNTVLSPFDFIDLKENWNCHLDEFVLSAINNKPQRVCSTTKRDFRNGVSGYLITNCVDGMVKYNIVKAIQKRFKRVKKSEVNSLSIIDVYRDIKNEEFETVDKSWIAKWISDNCKQVNLKKVRG